MKVKSHALIAIVLIAFHALAALADSPSVGDIVTICGESAVVSKGYVSVQQMILMFKSSGETCKPCDDQTYGHALICPGVTRPIAVPYPRTSAGGHQDSIGACIFHSRSGGFFVSTQTGELVCSEYVGYESDAMDVLERKLNRCYEVAEATHLCHRP